MAKVAVQESGKLGKSEVVICQIPFGTPAEGEVLAKIKDLGFTSVQIYTQWRLFEGAGRDRWDWSGFDRQVEQIQKAGLKYVPFLLMGPYYAAPDWWLTSKEHMGLRCLEHDKDCPIESVWNKAFYREIGRVAQAMSDHYLPWGVLESVQPGICGDYGEAIFPVLGNWPGTYHTHRGYWCGGADAKLSYRDYLEKQYQNVTALNRQWRTNFSSFAEIEPRMPHRCVSRSEVFDQMSWYRASMTNYCDIWMAACRKAFPHLPIYLCTGGADDETASGANFGQQAKVAAKYDGGIRLTNEGNTFAYNFPLTSHTHAACEFYGAYLGLEPVGPLTPEGVRARVFGSAAFGNRQLFHYYGNVFDPNTNQPKPAARALADNVDLIGQQTSEHGIAMFWPIDQATLNGCVTLQYTLTSEQTPALLHIRRQYPVGAISEELILDGILSRYRCLVMMGVSSTRAAVLERIARWVKEEGGTLLTTARTRDIELEPVAVFDELLGIGPESEDAWGHNFQELKLPEGFPAMSQLKGFHAERGWWHLAAETELLSTARGGVGSSGVEGLTWNHPVSALFRRRYPSGGQAIYYGGRICFKSEPQALFADPEVIAQLLNDVCGQSGVRPLGTQEGELVRARIGGKLLVLRPDKIDIQDDKG